MNGIPQFSFPFPSDIGSKNDQVSNNKTLPSSSSAPKQSHRRSQTSVNVSRTPLPTFSFGTPASERAEASMAAPVAQSSRELTLAPPLPASRHRRAVSEFIGEKQEHASPDPSIQPASSYRPAGMVHRHRRSHASGAINTADLPHFTAQSNIVAEPKLPASPTSYFSSSVDEYGQDAGKSLVVAEDTSMLHEEALAVVPQIVTSSESVDTIQPRPISVVSSASSGSQSTIRGKESSGAEAPGSGPTDPPAFDGSGPSTTTPELPPAMDSSSPNNAHSGTGVDIVDLDENFDSDPTAASTFTTGQEDTEVSFAKYVTPRPQSLSSDSPTLRSSPSEDIDLDLASVDMNPSPTRSSIRGSGFQKARASMHSAGPPSMLLSSGIPMHRRTESAPSLTPVPFLLRSHDMAADAGFEMTDVFEEDEDDCETSSLSSPPAVVLEGPYTTTSSDVTPKPLFGKREIHSSPTLLPPFQFDARRPREEDASLLRLRPPFITTHSEPSVSNASSPRYAHSGLSSCEPSPRLQHSVEDVPSLISSGSTIGETTLPNPSLNSFEPPVARAGSSQPSLAHSTRTHRKRLSIMSMSVSKLFSSSTPTIEEAELFEPPQSSNFAGLKPPRTKTRRLSRMLKFWKKPPTSPYSQ